MFKKKEETILISHQREVPPIFRKLDKVLCNQLQACCWRIRSQWILGIGGVGRWYEWHEWTQYVTTLSPMNDKIGFRLKSLAPGSLEWEPQVVNKYLWKREVTLPREFLFSLPPASHALSSLLVWTMDCGYRISPSVLYFKWMGWWWHDRIESLQVQVLEFS